MSKKTPTPPPWRYVPADQHASKNAHVECGDDCVLIVKCESAEHKTCANGRLAALSPELLVFLEEIAPKLKHTTLHDLILRMIAKAYGYSK